MKAAMCTSRKDYLRAGEELNSPTPKYSTFDWLNGTT
jgi:hypothetical protein